MNYCTKPIEKNHMDSVLSIWKNRMGREYPDKSKIRDAINKNKKHVFGFITIKKNSKEIVGFCIGKILEKYKAENMVSQINLFDSIINKVGLLDLNVVKKKYENKGIGKNQIKRREKYFKENNINTLLAICWIRDKNPNSKLILEKSGFECIETIENFWYEDTLNRNAKCIDCGYPCNCTAGIHIKKLK